MTTVEPGMSGDDLMPVKDIVQGLRNSAKILSLFTIRQTLGTSELSLECTDCDWRLNVSEAPTPLIKLVNEAHAHYHECPGSLSHDDDKTGSATD